MELSLGIAFWIKVVLPLDGQDTVGRGLTEQRSDLEVHEASQTAADAGDVEYRIRMIGGMQAEKLGMPSNLTQRQGSDDVVLGRQRIGIASSAFTDAHDSTMVYHGFTRCASTMDAGGVGTEYEDLSRLDHLGHQS